MSSIDIANAMSPEAPSSALFNSNPAGYAARAIFKIIDKSTVILHKRILSKTTAINSRIPVVAERDCLTSIAASWRYSDSPVMNTVPIKFNRKHVNFHWTSRQAFLALVRISKRYGVEFVKQSGCGLKFYQIILLLYSKGTGSGVEFCKFCGRGLKIPPPLQAYYLWTLNHILSSITLMKSAEHAKIAGIWTVLSQYPI